MRTVHEFPAEDAASLRSRTDNGAIQVEAWDRGVVSIDVERRIRAKNGGGWFGGGDTLDEGEARELLEGIMLQLGPAGDVMRAEAIVNNRRARRHGSLVHFTIRAPARLASDLETDNGKVTCRGMLAPVRARTDNGAIEVRAVGGKVTAQTDNGAIDLVDIDGDVIARTDNGAITLDNARGAVEAETDNGQVSGVRLTGPVSATTENGAIDLAFGALTGPPAIACQALNGAITVTLPAGLSFALTMESNSGRIACGYSLSAKTVSERTRLEGVAGDGDGTVRLKSETGRVTLRAR
jgi:hypothetical protein